MAYAAPLDFQRPPSQLSVDRKPSSFFDDFETVDSAMISPATGDRRDSFGNSTTLFSPTQSSLWDEDFPTSASTTTVSERQFNVPLNPFLEQSNNPFTRMDPSSFGQHQPSSTSPWFLFDRAQDSRTPVAATYEAFPGDFDSAPTPAFTSVTAASPFGHMPVQGGVRPTSVFPPVQAPVPLSATSPSHDKGYMAMAEQAAADSKSKRLRNESPSRSFSPFQSRGGIKKKAQRFEIPMERNLNNIDALIQACNNEDDIKELKQQKRLLRNRQAALDSRQRKKKQYEDAQEEKKACTERVSILEEELRRLSLDLEAERAERQNIHREAAELRQQLEEQTWNMENMVREHTLESGELRKKNAILTERLNEMSAAQSMPAQTATHDFADFANDMDGLTMSSEWDEYTFVNDFCMEPEATTPQPQKPVETTLVVGQRKKESASSDDQRVASGLLLMLLLCGAFVASNSGSSAPTIPRMPDEVRAASAAVLDSVFKDAGVAPSQPQPMPPNVISAIEPRPSGSAWTKPNAVVNANLPSSSVASDLDALTQALIQPTKEQEAEATFSLSTAQYLSLTSTDFTRSIGDEPLTPQSSESTGTHRRNLAETLKAMREEAKGETAAEVYTRSLLWDRIPTEVVKEFKRMVEQSSALEVQKNGNGGGGGKIHG